MDTGQDKRRYKYTAMEKLLWIRMDFPYFPLNRQSLKKLWTLLFPQYHLLLKEVVSVLCDSGANKIGIGIGIAQCCADVG